MNEKTYEKLVNDPPLGWWARYRLRSWTGRLLFALPLVARVLRKLGHTLTDWSSLGDEERRHRHYISLLRQGPAPSGNGSDPFGYAGTFAELQTVLKYHAQVADKDFSKNDSESPFLYGHIEETIGRLLAEDPGIPCMLNFGVSYAHVDSLLARRFPKTRFIGIDRAEITKAYNEFHFRDIPNLELLAGDVFELLASRRFDGGIFFHTRTLCVLPPHLIEKLYRAAAQAGFRYVVGMEQTGISRETGKAYRFSEEPQPSVLFRAFMYLHNYPALLKGAGYRVRDIGLHKTGHPHPDLRILSFTAALS